MLPPELTRARKREGKLLLSALSPAERARASEVAEVLISVTRAALGQPREEVEASWAAVPVAAKERKLLMALTHLVEARSEFTSPASAEPELVRRAVFSRAAQARAALADGQHQRPEHQDRVRHRAHKAGKANRRHGGRFGDDDAEIVKSNADVVAAVNHARAVAEGVAVERGRIEECHILCRCAVRYAER